ncbi:DUF2497 domain-containing protein [Nisaea denitrificans]|uniref:DUF2497 domain-containing protein n=1 Tax=Nisaea denitrificans TaxID=390877 RepID=UPI000687442A|nr:DUF2497 domain-containing protein [Nisaea denitrificans]
MSDTAQEPSMEEILASIRRIISEDGEEGEEAPPPEEAAEPEPTPEPEAEPEAEPEPEPEPEPEAEAEPEPEPEPEPEVEAEPEPEPEPDFEEEEDVLDLTDMEEEQPEPLFDEQKFKEDEPEPAPAPPPPPPPPPLQQPQQAPPAEGLVSPPQAAETVDAFSRLNEKLNEDYHELPIGNGAITLERLTRELMRPMLKEWLDQHLPMMVERLVREEIERLVMQSQRRDPW